MIQRNSDEDSTGLRSLLKVPWVYTLFQKLISRKKLWPDLLGEFLDSDHSRISVLDIGCGPGNFLQAEEFSFDHSRFVGIDPSIEYIQRAKKDFPRARFYCGTVADVVGLEGLFDLVVISGVLHHVSDQGATELLEFALNKVSPSGVIISVDPVIFEGQNPFARFMALSDRGQHVRSLDSLTRLWANLPGVGRVSATVKAGYLRVPYNHVVCVATSNRNA